MDIEIVENENSKPAEIDFKKIAEASKPEIQAAHAVKPTSGKGSRGPYKKKPKLGAGPVTNSEPGLANTTDAGPGSEALSMPPPKLAPILKAPLKSISKIPAAKFQIPELALTDEEANDVAEALDQVVEAFIPDLAQMDPRSAAILAAASTISSVGFQKYMIFKSTMDERKQAAQTVTEAPKQTNEPPPRAPEHAFDFEAH